MVSQTNNVVMVTNVKGIHNLNQMKGSTNNLNLRKPEKPVKSISQQFRINYKNPILNKISTNNLTTPSGKEFVSTWNTSLNNSRSSASNQLRLPLTAEGTYNFNVSWGDGNSDTITMWNQSQTTHTYVAGGIYTIIINGIIKGWNFDNGGDVLKIIEISQWGNLNLGNTGYNFYGARNLQVTATDNLNLTGTTNLAGLFKNCDLLTTNGLLNSWDVSKVMNMSEVFSGDTHLNQSLSNWNTSNVLNMSSMFFNCTSFDQPLFFNISNVTDLSNMFSLDTLSPNNYDHLLAYWSALPLQRNLTFNAGYSKYLITVSLDRQNIIAKYNWTIYDFGEITYPTPPQSLTSKSGSTYVTLSWSRPEYNGNSKIFKYYIFRSLDNSNYFYYNSVLGTVFRFTDHSVINASLYYYYITAVNIVGESNASNIVVAKPISLISIMLTTCACGGGTPGFLTVTVLISLLTIYWIRKKSKD